MRRIEATLPALGGYTVPFYKESEEVLEFLGDRELRRLDRVQHLGIAAKVFTGVNHSRLEYVLLQCAVINMLPRFHKAHEQFALSGTVRIPGQSNRVSSGEELLKCWALLGNAGHTQYTFGVERSLLKWARENPAFHEILLAGLPARLRRWGRSVIDEYRDTEFHYLLVLYRISQLPAHSRVKGRLFRILSSLLLPLDQIALTDSADRYKLFRLRRLFSQVRALCIVTLDAYYSHHPVRYQISGALMNLGTLMEDSEGKTGFTELLEQTAAWLADEIYLHPRAAAAQKHYELASVQKLNSVYKPRMASPKQFSIFFRNFLENGFGQPQVDRLANLARLSFPHWRFGAVFGKDEYEFARTIEAQLSKAPSTHVSILTNPYSDTIHVDLLYDRVTADSGAIADLCVKAAQWIARLVEAQALWRIRRLRVPDDAAARFRERFLKELVESSYPALRSLFTGIVQYILPQYHVGAMSEAIPRRGRHYLGFRFNYVRGGTYDSLTPSLDELIEKNPNDCPEDRIHELDALRRVVKQSQATFVVACLEKFIVRNPDGQHVDDWDGVMVEIFDDLVSVSIIEAKNLKTPALNESQAFSQLKKTRNLVCSKQKLKARRKRIRGLGAVLTFRL